MAMNTYNPAQIMLGGRGDGPPVWGSKPYMPTSPIKPVANPMQPPIQQSPQAQPQTTAAGSQAVRATGQGPYDSAYRQNLATYAGGMFSNPTGLLSFNPTDPNAFSNLPGSSQGGTPPTQLEQALGGNPFSWTQPSPQQPAQTQAQTPPNYWKFWLSQFNKPLNGVRNAMNSY